MRALVLLALVLVACGGDKEPAKSADPSVASTPTATAPMNTEPGPAASPDPAPVAKKRKPYEIVNLCPRPATIIFGDDPKASTAGRKTLGGNDKIDDGPRDPEGNQIIWLIVREEPLVKVRVSRGTKRIEIGTSCDTLEMH